MDRATDPDVRLLRGACDFRCCNVGQPTVSHHLKVLREAGWVRTERRASRVYYSLEPGVVERFLAIAGDLMTPPTMETNTR